MKILPFFYFLFSLLYCLGLIFLSIFAHESWHYINSEAPNKSICFDYSLTNQAHLETYDYVEFTTQEKFDMEEIQAYLITLIVLILGSIFYALQI